MSAWLYRILWPLDWSDDRALALARRIGDEPLHAWLDDETRESGVLLDDQVAHMLVARFMREWPRGRIFGARAEARWQYRIDGGMTVVVTDDENPPDEAQDVIPLTPVSEPSPLLLWGQRRTGGWDEARIPQVRHCYPHSWRGPYAAVLTRRYEAPLPGAGRIAPGVRVVTRYLAFDGNYAPQHEPLPAVRKAEP